MALASDPPAGLPLLTLGHIFLRTGTTAFGGLETALTLVERELVTKRQWLTATDVTEALIYTKLLPGSSGPQVVSYLGYKLGGWSGSAVATAAFVFPSALLMLVLATAYVSVTAVPAMRPAINGLILVALGWNAHRRSLASMALAAILLAPGLATRWTPWEKFAVPVPPAPVPLSLAGCRTLAVNLFCAFFLARFRAYSGSLTRAAFLSARNDTLANIAIIAAGLVTAMTISP